MSIVSSAAIPGRAEVHLYDPKCGCDLCGVVEVACSIAAIGEAGRWVLDMMEKQKPQSRLRSLYGEAAVALKEAHEAMHRYIDAAAAIKDEEGKR